MILRARCKMTMTPPPSMASTEKDVAVLPLDGRRPKERMLPEIAGKMPADGERDVLPLRRPRGRHKDGSRPSVWKGIRRPLFARRGQWRPNENAISNKSWRDGSEGRGTSSRISKRAASILFRTNVGRTKRT